MINNEKSITYTVWVGGIPDIENAPLDKAKLIYQQWIDNGYDDVIIEETA